MRDIGLASLTVSILTIFPPILVMTMVNKVMQFHSMSTLILLSSIMVVVWVYETFLGYARRAIIAVVGARLDTKLNLHLFSRLLRLPLDYFERHPAGETMYQVARLPGPRVPHRAISATFSNVDPGGAVAVPVLAQCAIGVGRLAVRRSDLGHHPRLSEADAGDVQPGRRGRDVEGGDIRQDDRRHQDSEGAGIEAAAPRPMGRAGRRDRQMAARIRPIVELAANIGDAARALHDDGHVIWRLLGDGRCVRLCSSVNICSGPPWNLFVRICVTFTAQSAIPSHSFSRG